MDNAIGFEAFLDALELDSILRETVPAVLADTSTYYRQFRLPKRSGGFRAIDSPYPSLAFIQRRILEKFISSIPSHDIVFSFKRGGSAIQHAAHHLGQKELLILDLADFFGTVSRQKVFQVFYNSGLSSEFAHYASLLCCLNGFLPQGACTSPALSNLVFGRVDERLLRLAKKLNIKYSRYADDLAFSGNYIPRNLPRTVRQIVESEGFRINEKKTRLKIAGAKKIIVGVSISSGELKVPKIFKRELRAKIYELNKHVHNLSDAPLLDPFIYERILGKLNYVLQVEPENEFALHHKKILSMRHQDFLAQAQGIFLTQL